MKKQVANNISFFPLEKFIHDNITVIDGKESLHNVIAVKTNKSFFGVYERSKYLCKDSFSLGRRDYYKITVITNGSGILRYGDKQIKVKPGALIFVNPAEIKGWHAESEEQDGYFCIFTEHYFSLSHEELKDLLQHPLFQNGINPVIQLNDEQLNITINLFEKIMYEHQSCNPFKDDAIRLYLKLLLVEAKRFCNHSVIQIEGANAAQNIVHRFDYLLESQFPVVRVTDQVQLKSVTDFAIALNVHSNHLNASVKKVTGYTASHRIGARFLREAKLLLMHTDWHINEIAWCLGFEEPASFAHFFKKHAGITANQFRQQAD